MNPQNTLFPETGTRNSPEKVRLGVEPEVDPLEVDVELGNPGVGHADSDSQEVGVLAKVERRGQHHHAGLWGPSRSLPQQSQSCRSNSPRSPHAPVPLLLDTALPARGGSARA